MLVNQSVTHVTELYRVSRLCVLYVSVVNFFGGSAGAIHSLERVHQARGSPSRSPIVLTTESTEAGKPRSPRKKNSEEILGCVSFLGESEGDFPLAG